MADKDDYSQASGGYFDRQYSMKESYWGDQPNLIIPLLSSHLQPGSRALVIGCGEGRDALFLARIGFDVVATEIAEAGLERIRKAVEKTDVKLQPLKLDAHDPHEHLGKFDAVLTMNVLQFLNPELLADRIAHFQSLVRRGGFMAVQVFTIEDPEYQAYLKEQNGSPENLVVPHGIRGYRIRYFRKGELSSFFRGWELIYYHEGLVWDKPHGPQTDFHKHGMAQMIAKKKLSGDIV